MLQGGWVVKKKRPEFVDGSDMNFGGVRNCGR